MRPADRFRWLLSGVGQAMITAGVVLLLFVGYELWFTNTYTHAEQKKLDKALDRTWQQPPPKTQLAAYRDGEGIARIYLPTLGKDQVHVVVEGVTRADLKKGPGHYPGTDLPGQIGNMVISGHRTTYGAPFNRLDEIKVGDPIVIETRTAFFTYRAIRSFVVLPTAVGETDHVPNQPGVKPTQRLLTLTTCNPKYSARTRLVVRGLLESAVTKRPGLVPPALAG